MRLIVLTAFTLICFAGNSLLTRAAIGGHEMDAWMFMLVRLVTGAITLAALVRLRTAPSRGRGSWAMAAELAGYAVFFTLAYVRVATGPGALILFGSVQLTMFAAAFGRGERLSLAHWVGVALALAGFLVLTLPGLSAPDPLGAALMAAAGICWGAYSIAGRGATDPLAVTADNFLRAAVVALVIVLGVGFRGPYSVTGFALASASGAVASGLGYAAWYTVLPTLPVWRAATTQLAVPVIAAVGAAALLREPIHARLAIAMVLVVFGIWLTTRTATKTRSTSR